MSHYKRNSITSSMACWYNPTTNVISNSGKMPGFLYFASQHELAVYRQLMSFTSYVNKGISIATQHVVTIKPPSNQLGMLHWKVDFALQESSTGEHLAYIEAKGGWILVNHLYSNEFYQKLHMWDAFYPDTFKKLYVVGDNTLCGSTSAPVKIWSIAGLVRQLFEDLG